MKVVSVGAASARAQLTRARWLQQAHASAASLESKLGSGEVGDFMPGLGDLLAWGLAGEGSRSMISGALVTGFPPSPETVSVMMTALVANNRLDLGPLALLAALPRHCFDRFGVGSWLLHGQGITILDRGQIVVQTRSRQAAKLSTELLVHLVRGAEPVESDDEDVTGTPLFVKHDEGGIVTEFRMVPPTSSEPGWVHIEDWAE